MIDQEIRVKFEVENNFYQVGDKVKGTLSIHAEQPVSIDRGTLEWFTRMRIGEGDAARTEALVSEPVELTDLCTRIIDGEGTFPFKTMVPETTPVTVTEDIVHDILIDTGLIIKLRLGDPFNTIIAREIPLKVISLPRLRKGVVQTIEFPLRRFCARSTWVTAHVELARRYFTLGERVEATVIVDLERSPTPIHGISLSLKQIVEIQGLRIEDELMEGPRTVGLPEGKRTAVTVSTAVPRTGFVPQVSCDVIKISHSALLLLHCPYGLVVESEIPIEIVHPEAR